MSRPGYVEVWVGPNLYGFAVEWTEEVDRMGWRQWMARLELSNVEGPDGLVDEVGEAEMVEAEARAEEVLYG